MSALKRVVIFCSLLAFFIFLPKVMAAETDTPVITSPTVETINSTNYDDEIHVQRLSRNLMEMMYCILANTNPFGAACYGDKITVTNSGGTSMVEVKPVATKNNQDGGALAMVTGATTSLYQMPPTSSVMYLAGIGESVGLFPKTAYAQGIGGSGEGIIHVVYRLWQITRNVAYFFFILIFIVVGFMIMFRQKINPQTVIGVQQALPGLVISILLVTISYFISSVIIDFTFAGTSLVAYVFNSSQAPNIYNPDQALQDSSIFTMYSLGENRVNNVVDTVSGVFSGSFSTLTGQSTNQITPRSIGAEALTYLITIPYYIGGPTGIWVGEQVNDRILDFVGLKADKISNLGSATMLSSLAALIIPLIILVALMIQFFRLLLALIGTYIQILVMVIAGPFLILFSAIPGKGGSLGYWLRGLIGNAMVFPAVFAGFLFAGMILATPNTDWQNTTVPLFGGLSVDLIKSLLGFGILLGLPAIPDMVRNAFGVKGPQGFTQAAMGGFMGGVAVGRAGIGRATNYYREEAQSWNKQAAANRAGAGGALGPQKPWYRFF